MIWGAKASGNTGCSGRISVVEVFFISDEIRKLIVQRKSAEVIKNFAIEQGMLTLRMAAICKVIRGEVSLQEACRISSPDELEGLTVPEFGVEIPNLR